MISEEQRVAIRVRTLESFVGVFFGRIAAASDWTSDDMQNARKTTDEVLRRTVISGLPLDATEEASREASSCLTHIFAAAAETLEPREPPPRHEH